MSERSLPLRFIALTALLVVMVAGASGCAAVAFGGATAGGAAVAYDRRTTGTIIDDESIENRIANQLYAETERWEQLHVAITSVNGRVLLTGEAPTEELKQWVNDTANAATLVREIHDYVAVESVSSLGTRSNDTLMTTRVKTALLNASVELGSRTKVVTERSEVYLMGLLTQAEAEQVTDIARRVEGVKLVIKLFEYVADEPPPATA